MAEIIAKGVSVDITIYQGTSRSLRHALLVNPLQTVILGAQHVGGAIRRGERGTIVVRALDDVSFTISHNERIGLIGQNGAGKTTLLRAMAGIYEPTAGTLSTTGRVVPLFNLIEGLRPEVTGREFIDIRGALLGFSRAEVTNMVPDVIEFCELGDYINMPVRTYSTGMLVRLAFAIVTAVTADVLLFDELIGAGDARFYEKAKARLERFVERSSLMVVASHSRDILETWCTQCFLLEHGKLITTGPVAEVYRIYEKRQAKA
jgi:ABC-2 type transport system ATP-binding protein/lipopolysaccharide transport system ATP-binding protein